jgi:Ca2+-binding RTX toxin-like protein
MFRGSSEGLPSLLKSGSRTGNTLRFIDEGLSVGEGGVGMLELISPNTRPLLATLREEDDRIYGLTGNDVLYGDEGQDHVYGGEGFDWLRGGSGNDFLHPG